MKKTKKILSIIIAVMMILTAVPLTGMTAFAAGTDFVIDGNGVLTAYNGAGGDIVIPDGVTSIGDEAFLGCTKLTSIEIPDSVTSIGNKAFESCENLASIEISDSIKSIGDEAFSYCVSLTSIVIPNGVTSISMGAFYSCIGLKSVTLSGSVTSIDEYAFCWCDSLTDVYFIGTEEQRNEMSIGSYNQPFTQATIHFIVKHEHMFDMAWTTNATAHWHKCIAEDCDITNYAECGITEAAYGTHTWENGVCTVCGYECDHNGMISGICEICGAWLFHIHGYTPGDWKYDETSHWYICTQCNQPIMNENHNWVDGKCSVCEYECTHNFVEGVCEICGYEESVEPEGYSIVDVCPKCGEIKPDKNGDFLCDKCGEFFADAATAACYFVCPKCGENDADKDGDFLCDKCGETVHTHEYIDGVCLCGAVDPDKQLGYVKEVTYTPSVSATNTYEVKVEGRPSMIQFYDSHAGTRSFDRNSEKVLEIKHYDADGNEVGELSRNIAYEVWTVKTILEEDTYIVRAKGSGESKWEAVTDENKELYTFENKYETPDAKFISVEAPESGKKGAVLINVTAEGADIERITVVNEGGDTVTATLANGRIVKDADGIITGTLKGWASHDGVNTITVKIYAGGKWVEEQTVTYIVGNVGR